MLKSCLGTVGITQASWRRSRLRVVCVLILHLVLAMSDFGSLPPSESPPSLTVSPKTPSAVVEANILLQVFTPAAAKERGPFNASLGEVLASASKGLSLPSSKK